MDAEKLFKILIVDDERSNIIALNHILKPMYTVFAAIDGKTALKMVQEVMPDLILLDVLMPDISGFGVLAELKRFNLTRKIPVIFITGLDSTEDEETGFALGAVDYITKPFHTAIVKARVKTQLQMVEYIRTIERLSLLDTLTNISNRRGFDNRINIEWNRAFRKKEPISLFMVDIDHFKNYNDTYGHQQGDAYLQTFAHIFCDSFKRKMDFCARWGGEEFVALLPSTDMEGALSIAEQLRANVERENNPSTDEICFPTISIGVNTIIPSADDTVTEFISGADKALYEAKNTGRNKVCGYRGAMKEQG